MKIVVTGGAGFIGSALVRHLIADSPHVVHVVDKLTYAGNLAALAPAAGDRRYAFTQADICDMRAMREIVDAADPDAIVHLAAETHVDRSIDGPSAFVQTNLVGTAVLLECARSFWEKLPPARRDAFRFHHVSTDEVFGTLGPSGSFREDTAYDPRSPYSASKAGSDHLVRAWGHTYGLPVIVTNTSNNYGPYQFPEKLIPLVIIKALSGEPLPVYGQGENVRDWIHVDDHARALRLVLERARPLSTYNIGAEAERRNIDVVRAICGSLDRLRPRGDSQSYASQIAFVTDRPGHDARYAIDASLMRRDFSWRPGETFETGLEKTILWYLENEPWWRSVGGAYAGERLGLASR